MRNFLKVLILVLIFNFNDAFNPGWSEGSKEKGDRTHYEITECALYRITYDLLKSTYSNITSSPPVSDNGRCINAKEIILILLEQLKLDSKKYMDAIKRIAESNSAVDFSEPEEARSHFNDEAFITSALYLLELRLSTITSCRSENFDSARDFFGRLLHTVQDFYSHSNWVQFSRSINEKLAKSTSIGNVVNDTIRACFNCSSFSDCKNNVNTFLIENRLLTSGYITSRTVPAGKCKHGEDWDGISQWIPELDGISKDSTKSAHSYLHNEAANLAEISSYLILKDLWETIGSNSFKNFLGFRGYSLIITMDTTGSMSNEIQAAKQISYQILNTYLTQSNPPLNYILSPFNDPGYGPLTITENPYIFSQKINDLVATGGGDEPELFYSGVLAALEVCEPYSLMFTFTDASAKDNHLRNQVVSVATKKSVKIIPVLTANTREEMNSKASFFDEYNQLAQLTGGFSIYTDKINVLNISSIILQELNMNLQPILLANYKTLNTYESEFFVDSSIQVLNFYITSDTTAIQYTIINPINSLITYEWKFNTSRTKSFSLTSPPVGKWIINIKSGSFDLKITGMSKISISSTLNYENNNQNHPGYNQIDGSPIQGTSLIIFSTIQNTNIVFEEYLVDLVSVSNVLLQRVRHQSNVSYLIETKIEVPKEKFRIRVSAFINKSEAIVRYQPEIYNPSALKLNFGYNKNLSNYMIPGEMFELNYNIANEGDTNIQVDISIQDRFNFIRTQNRVTINANKSYSGVNLFRVPNNSSLIGDIDAVTLSALATGSVNPFTNVNFRTIYIGIQSKNVSFDANTVCEILNDTRLADCSLDRCEKDKTWYAYLNISNVGAGLASINVINGKDEDIPRLNVTHEAFTFGSDRTLTIDIEASCCTQYFDIIASDIYGNTGVCSFRSIYEIKTTTKVNSNATKLFINFFNLFLWTFSLIVLVF